jgi:hypothetical protein
MNKELAPTLAAAAARSTGQDEHGAVASASFGGKVREGRPGRDPGDGSTPRVAGRGERSARPGIIPTLRFGWRP